MSYWLYKFRRINRQSHCPCFLLSLMLQSEHNLLLLFHVLLCQRIFGNFAVISWYVVIVAFSLQRCSCCTVNSFHSCTFLYAIKYATNARRVKNFTLTLAYSTFCAFVAAKVCRDSFSIYRREVVGGSYHFPASNTRAADR